MSDAITGIILSIGGLLIIAISFAVTATRSKKDQVVSWRGFGVTFEIKPCGQCPSADVGARDPQQRSDNA